MILFRACRKIHFLANKLWQQAQRQKIAVEDQRYTSDQIPWSHGYIRARERCIVQAMGAPEIEFALMGGQLPPGYGFGMDERTIELPWVYSFLKRTSPNGKVRMLDAGSACNHIFFLERLIPFAQLDIMTLAPENVCEFGLGISYQYGDLRDLPYKNSLFDVVTCISTLEHVGMDNCRFKEGMREHSTADLFIVLRELSRVLKSGGLLLLTVPFGRYQDLGWFQQFDAALLAECRSVFVPQRSEEFFYLYSSSGWQCVEAQACADACYAEPPGGDDNAAAARAVACCAWWK